MNNLQQYSIPKAHANGRATSEDFCKTFTENMDSLYLLSLLLTGDHQTAERCFIVGFEDSLASDKVFEQSAFARAKQAIIQNAIRAVPPFPGKPCSSTADVFRASYQHPNGGDLEVDIVNVLALPDFERFVFVMSVLEHYPEHYCALLLGCSVQDIHRARLKAFWRLAGLLHSDRSNENVQDLPEVSR